MKKFIYVLIIVLVLCLAGLIVYKIIDNKETNKYKEELKEVKSFDCRKLSEEEMEDYELEIIHSFSIIRNTDVYSNGDTRTRYKIAKRALKILKSKKCVSHIYYDKKGKMFTYETGDTLTIWELRDRDPLFD